MGWRQRRKRDSNADDKEEIDNTVANDNKQQPWHITDCHYPGKCLQMTFHKCP